MNLLTILPTGKSANESHHLRSIKSPQNQAPGFGGDHQDRRGDQVGKLRAPDFPLQLPAGAKARVVVDFSNFDDSLFSWGHIPPSMCRSDRSLGATPG